MNLDWYTILNEGEVDTPALLVYPDRITQNITLIKQLIGDPDRLRPHIKTHKTKEITFMMIRAGIHRFKCATIAEAEMLAMCKATDVLLAYPLNDVKLARFVKLIHKYPETTFSAIVDDPASALKISEVAIKNGLIIQLYVDLNVGMNRTGIKPGTDAVNLYEYGSGLKGIRFRGLHAYDGHVREPDIELRRQICQHILAGIIDLKNELINRGFENISIVIGGSPSFPIYAGYDDLECSPGTFALWDKGYLDAYPEQAFLPAALLMARIISVPDERKLCIDLGYKAVASENALDRRIFFLNLTEVSFISQSEEHLVVETKKSHHRKIGEVLYALPIHICPTCALYNEMTVVNNRIATESWNVIARNRKIVI